MGKIFIKWFEDLKIGDVPLVGGKNASLGEMIRNLGEKGVSVPGGFAVTAYAYKYTIEKQGLIKKSRRFYLILIPMMFIILPNVEKKLEI